MLTSKRYHLLPACLRLRWPRPRWPPASRLLSEVRLDSASQSAMMYPPLENWAAPQFYQRTRRRVQLGWLVRSQGRRHGQGRRAPWRRSSRSRRAGWSTRAGLHNPVYGSGGPFAHGEVRVYQAAGNCGIPAGSNRILAVSVAVTTLPTTASGDVEVIANGLTARRHGADGRSRPDSGTARRRSRAWTPAGNFQVQVRSTPAKHGHRRQRLLRADGPQQHRRFLQHPRQFRLGRRPAGRQRNRRDRRGDPRRRSRRHRRAAGARRQRDRRRESGGLRVRGAGVNTDTLAFIHQTACQRTVCADTHYTRIENPQTFSATRQPVGPAAVRATTGWHDGTKPVSVVYQTGTTCAGGSAGRQRLVPVQRRDHVCQRRNLQHHGDHALIGRSSAIAATAFLAFAARASEFRVSFTTVLHS